MANLGPVPAAQASSSSSSSPFAAFEPDNQWKLNLKQRIQRSLAPRVAEAQRTYSRQCEAAGAHDPVRRAQIESQHTQTMADITMAAQKTFQDTLRREINLRRWELDPTCLTPAEEADIRQYQANIWDSATAAPSGNRSRSGTMDARTHEHFASSPPNREPLSTASSSFPREPVQAVPMARNNSGNRAAPSGFQPRSLSVERSLVPEIRLRGSSAGGHEPAAATNPLPPVTIRRARAGSASSVGERDAPFEGLPMANGFPIRFQGWRPTAPVAANQNDASSRTLATALLDSLNPVKGSFHAHSDDESSSELTRSRIKERPRQDRTRRRLGHTSPLLLDPQRSQPSQSVSFVAAHGTPTGSPNPFDPVELPPMPTSVPRPPVPRKQSSRLQPPDATGPTSAARVPHLHSVRTQQALATSRPWAAHSVQSIIASAPPTRGSAPAPSQLVERIERGAMGPPPPPSLIPPTTSQQPSTLQRSNTVLGLANRVLNGKRSATTGTLDPSITRRTSPLQENDRPLNVMPSTSPSATEQARGPLSSSPGSMGWYGNSEHAIYTSQRYRRESGDSVPSVEDTGTLGRYKRGSSSMPTADDVNPYSTTRRAPQAATGAQNRPITSKQRPANLRDEEDDPNLRGTARPGGRPPPRPISENGSIDLVLPSPPDKAGVWTASVTRKGSQRSRNSREAQRIHVGDIFSFSNEPGGPPLDDEDWNQVDHRNVRSLGVEEALSLQAEALAKGEEVSERAKILELREAEVKGKEDELRKEREELHLEKERVRRERVEAERVVEKAWKREQEIAERDAEVKRREAALLQRAADAERREEEVRKKEEELRHREAEVWQKEEETRRQEREAKRKEGELKRKEEDLHRVQMMALQREENTSRESRKFEEDLCRREADLHLREADLSRREILHNREKTVTEREDVVRAMEERLHQNAQRQRAPIMRRITSDERTHSSDEPDLVPSSAIPSSPASSHDLSGWEDAGSSLPHHPLPVPVGPEDTSASMDEHLPRNDSAHFADHEGHSSHKVVGKATRKRAEKVRKLQQEQRIREGERRRFQEEEHQRWDKERLGAQTVEEEEERQYAEISRAKEEERDRRQQQEGERQRTEEEAFQRIESERIRQEQQARWLQEKTDAEHERLRAEAERNARMEEVTRRLADHQATMRTREYNEHLRQDNAEDHSQQSRTQQEEQLRQDEQLAKRLQEEEEAEARRMAQGRAQERKRLLQQRLREEEQRRVDAFQREQEFVRQRREHDDGHTRQRRIDEEEDRRLQDELPRRDDRQRMDSAQSWTSSTSASASMPASTSTSRPIPVHASGGINSTDRGGASSSNWGTPGVSSNWTSTRGTSNPIASGSRPTAMPTTGTSPGVNQGRQAGQPGSVPGMAQSFGSNHSGGGGTSRPTPMSEHEWARRQAENAQKQQEAFMREQERAALEKSVKAAAAFSKEDIGQLYARHAEQWQVVRNAPKLRWDTFPWPVLRKPNVPEDLTTDAIAAYVLSPHNSSDSGRTEKDRIKEHIKRWHPDRFETQLLPKVNEEEREKVKNGAGWVARALNELLTRTNTPGLFG